MESPSSPEKDPATGTEKMKSKGPKSKTMADLRKELAVLTSSVSAHSEILSSLKDVPALIVKLANKNQTNSDEAHNEDTDSSNPEVLEDDLDPIAALLKASKPDDTEDELDENLINILNMTQPAPEFGPQINGEVAKSISRLFSQKSSKEIVDKLKSGAIVPENCKSLAVARVNSEIWSILPPKLKQTDFAHQQQQQYVASASVMLSRTVDKLFKSSNKLATSREEILKELMEVMTLLGTLSQEMEQKRRLDIKPALNSEVASICSLASGGNLLFGENLADHLKTAKATNNMIRSTQRGYQLNMNRTTPYRSTRQTLNWRGPPRRGGQRGRPFPRHQANYPQQTVRPNFRKSQ